MKFKIKIQDPDFPEIKVQYISHTRKNEMTGPLIVLKIYGSYPKTNSATGKNLNFTIMWPK